MVCSALQTTGVIVNKNADFMHFILFQFIKKAERQTSCFFFMEKKKKSIHGVELEIGTTKENKKKRVRHKYETK